MQYRPYTSKDIDFFGRQDLGRHLATYLGADLGLPDIDRQTPNAAVVVAKLAGREVVIDILHNVLGIPTRELVSGAVELELVFETEDGPRPVRLVLMHPFHRFVSRAVSVHHPAIQRRDALALRQLRASLWVLAAFLDDLADLDVRAAGRWARRLAHALARHPQVLLVDVGVELDFDPLDILTTLKNDDRLDPRFRRHQIGRCVADVKKARRLLAGRASRES